MSDIDTQLREISAEVKDLGKQMAVNNHILAEHTKRSTQLEERFKPIEDTHKFLSRAFILLMGSGGVLALLNALHLL